MWRCRRQTRSPLQRPSGESSDPTSPTNPFRFSGNRLDTGSGTLSMGVRRFGPDVGHFLRPDFFYDSLANLSLSRQIADRRKVHGHGRSQARHPGIDQSPCRVLQIGDDPVSGRAGSISLRWRDVPQPAGLVELILVLDVDLAVVSDPNVELEVEVFPYRTGQPWRESDIDRDQFLDLVSGPEHGDPPRPGRYEVHDRHPGGVRFADAAEGAPEAGAVWPLPLANEEVLEHRWGSLARRHGVQRAVIRDQRVLARGAAT